ncbi:MAG: biosynthetic arginine decarboxylase [Planctomycetota bacterium]|nr:biosynthetic arginine decarboxylase [Planctomycetota bacterium]
MSSGVSKSGRHNAFLHGRWTPSDSANLYGLPDWGKGYFGVSEHGRLMVMPDKRADRQIDLYDLVERLREQGYTTPLLFRFNDILEDRMREISGAFRKAMREAEYTGDYRCVYPIKVNQQRQVVERIRDLGDGLGFGLEAGSKPELLAVLGMTAGRPHMPIICNGFKDDEFIETVILATKLGRNIIPVVEKFSELELLVKYARVYNVRPQIGVRVKISSRGVGRWESSGGVRSKFGLFISEIVDALEYLKSHGMADCLNMVHCHIGSQICDIRNMKNAVTELAHIYSELRRLGAGMKMIDVGGGLGVDYDGSQSAFESSMNYTIEEYAADIVYRIKAVCDDVNTPHPMIISESGRALVAYSSALVFDVLGVSGFDRAPAPDELETALVAEDEVPQPIVDLHSTYSTITDRNLLEAYHDALQARDETMSLFSLGYVSLPMRALAERLFWAIGREIMTRSARLREAPEEFAELPILLSDIYFCNFSLFQSMPDSWAIDQLFPICPIHRLDEEPSRLGILADITCDSDGKVDHFVDKREDKRALELHPLRRGEKYYLAAFLVGAYQEILGDLHNLLGDTHAVHVTLNENGTARIDGVIPGDSVSKVLSYVQLSADDLRKAIGDEVKQAVRQGSLTTDESRSFMGFITDGLEGYTYLEEDTGGEAAAPAPTLEPSVSLPSGGDR